MEVLGLREELRDLPESPVGHLLFQVGLCEELRILPILLIGARQHCPPVLLHFLLLDQHPPAPGPLLPESQGVTPLLLPVAHGHINGRRRVLAAEQTADLLVPSPPFDRVRHSTARGDDVPEETEHVQQVRLPGSVGPHDEQPRADIETEVPEVPPVSYVHMSELHAASIHCVWHALGSGYIDPFAPSTAETTSPAAPRAGAAAYTTAPSRGPCGRERGWNGRGLRRALVDGDGVLAAALRARGIAVRAPAGS